MLEHAFILVPMIVVVALIFDFINGFHDAANAIATVVITRTLTPFQAVLLAGIANFVGYFAFGLAVANTIGKGVVETNIVTLHLILAALLGAIIWNIATWIAGLPTSSSHALIGGIVGSALAASGTGAVIWSGLAKIFLFILVAPLLGMIGSMIFTIIVLRLSRRGHPAKLNSKFRILQLFSSTIYSIGHGTNDAQKTMAIIALALFSGRYTDAFILEPWIIFSCYTAISLGTMCGGWRIVKTMGTRITKIRAVEGFCAETAAASILLGTAHFGIPVSTTHVIAGSIMGVGAVEHISKVRWIMARKILWAWILTIPLTAVCAAIAYHIISFIIYLMP